MTTDAKQEVDELARALYEAHRATFAWYTPSWDQVIGSHRAAWHAAARRAVELVPRGAGAEFVEAADALRKCLDTSWGHYPGVPEVVRAYDEQLRALASQSRPGEREDYREAYEELFAAVVSDIAAGRADVDAAIAEFGYDSNDFAERRRGWHSSTQKTMQLLAYHGQAHETPKRALSSQSGTRGVTPGVLPNPPPPVEGVDYPTQVDRIAELESKIDTETKLRTHSDNVLGERLNLLIARVQDDGSVLPIPPRCAEEGRAVTPFGLTDEDVEVLAATLTNGHEVHSWPFHSDEKKQRWLDSARAGLKCIVEMMQRNAKLTAPAQPAANAPEVSRGE